MPPHQAGGGTGGARRAWLHAGRSRAPGQREAWPGRAGARSRAHNPINAPQRRPRARRPRRWSYRLGALRLPRLPAPPGGEFEGDRGGGAGASAGFQAGRGLAAPASTLPAHTHTHDPGAMRARRTLLALHHGLERKRALLRPQLCHATLRLEPLCLLAPLLARSRALRVQLLGRSSRIDEGLPLLAHAHLASLRGECGPRAACVLHLQWCTAIRPRRLRPHPSTRAQTDGAAMQGWSCVGADAAGPEAAAAGTGLQCAATNWPRQGGGA